MLRVAVLVPVFLWLLLPALPCAGQERSPEGSETGETVEVVQKVDEIGLFREWPGSEPFRGLGLGLAPFYFYDFQRSLDYTFAETLVTERDLVRGTSRTTRVPGDPGLNNRKFDLEMKVQGPGIQVPLALPSLGGGEGFSLFPTVAFEVAAADVTFDFLDRNQPELSTSLEGNGPMFSAGVELGGRVCSDCPWTASWSYWYRNLPDVSVGRATTLSVPGQEVFLDDVTLSRETHEVAARTAYTVQGTENRRWAPYAGVLYQKTDVEVEDLLGLRSPGLGLETETLSSSRFESDVVRALAGVDVQIGEKLFGRFETSAGEGDYGLRWLLVWNRWRWSEEGKVGIQAPRDTQDERLRERAEKLAIELAPMLAEIERRFLAGWKELTVVETPPGRSAYLVSEVETLLDGTEKAMLDALEDPMLTALRDWVNDRFEWTRSGLGIEVRQAASPLGGAVAEGADGREADFYAVARSGISTVPRPVADASLESGAYAGVCKPSDMAAKKSFDVIVKFETKLPEAQRGDASLIIYPRYYRKRAQRLPPGQVERKMRGSYSYEVEYELLDSLLCDASRVPPGPTGICALNLVNNPQVVLTCDDSACRHEGPTFSDLRECKRHDEI